MRYIDLSQLKLPDGWLQQAADAKQAVADGDRPEDHSQVWTALKHQLAELFPDQKCWYCETVSTRDDNAVDHFRPKGRVKEAQQPHAGYRWLAFDHFNFRYSCTLCNSRRVNVIGDTAGGKADCFPLMDEGQRVYVEGPCDAEQPALLDPCNIRDWRLLGCKHENGKPCAVSANENEVQRAEISIEIYHLHHEPTCNARHRVAVQFIQDVDETKQLYLAMTVSEVSQIAYQKTAGKVARAIARNAPFSGDMHFLLRSQRDTDHPWIQELLEI